MKTQRCATCKFNNACDIQFTFERLCFDLCKKCDTQAFGCTDHEPIDQPLKQGFISNFWGKICNSVCGKHKPKDNA